MKDSATVKFTSEAMTSWAVKVAEKTYRVATYPDSDLLFVESEAGRRVHPGPALVCRIRAAIAEGRLVADLAAPELPAAVSASERSRG